MNLPTRSGLHRPWPWPAGRFLIHLALGVAVASIASGDATLRAGRAKVKITPPVGSVMGNSYGITVSKGVASDLYAKAVVFELDGRKTALVACDLISLHRPIVAKTRALIAETTGLDPAHVILTATHAHAGPQTHPLFYRLAGKEAAALSRRYVEELPGLIARSVRLAEKDLQPARLLAGSGREDTISFNRRFLLRDGTVKTNPGRRNPEAVRPLGPIDPEVGIVYIETPHGEPLATLVNFALHVAIVTGDQISADYPHTLSRILASVKGDEMLTLFTNGMSGNINHIDVAQANGLGGEAEAARVGSILAAAVLKTYPTLRPVDPLPLAAASRAVLVPAPNPPSQAVGPALETLASFGRGASFPAVIAAWRTADQAEFHEAGGIESEVQALTFGRDLALVGFPGDSFVELGLAIKQNSPFAVTLISEQSGNGALSYIPNRKAFAEGGYEVESARVAPGGGELLAEAAIELLGEMFPRPE